MDCKEFKKLIPNYNDVKISSKQTEKFQIHLNSCSNCSILFHKYIKTMELLKPKADIEEQAFYFTRLKQRMENHYSQKRSILSNLLLRRLIQPAIYLGSLILAVYVGILIGSSSVNQNQYSELKYEDTDFIQSYAEYQYVNDFEIEPIENLFFDNKENVDE